LAHATSRTKATAPKRYRSAGPVSP
jgi:hypothetical protein